MLDLKEFDDLINLGCVSRTIKLGKREIVLRTLNSGEYADAMARVPRTSDALDDERLEAMQREVVSASIRSIDGKELDAESKASLVSRSQLILSNLLYTEYLSMVDEQGKIIEEARKNSSRETVPSPSSRVVPVSS